MKAGKRLGPWLLCVGLIAAVPAFGSTNVAAATRAGAHAAPHAAVQAALKGSAHPMALPFRGARHTAHSSGRLSAAAAGHYEHVTGKSYTAAPALTRDPAAATARATRTTPSARPAPAAPATSSTAPTELAGFQGTAQSASLTRYGSDQGVSPPDPNLAVGPNQVVEATNNTLYVFSRTGTYEFSLDLNVFLNGSSAASFDVTDPRVIYDAQSSRFYFSELDIDASQSGVCGKNPAIDVVAVSPSSTLSASDSWFGFGWFPFASSTDGLVGDQPELGISSNLVTATQNIYDNCTGDWAESETLVIQKSDLLAKKFSTSNSVYDIYNGWFAPQPVQQLGINAWQYVVWNNSDAGEGGCTPSCSVGAFVIHGTPEAKNVGFTTVFEPMSPTVLACSPFCTPPADQPVTADQLQTDDDRFLNAVLLNNKIWTSDTTSCTPSGDTTVRSCLDYVSIGANTSGVMSAGTQLNDVGISKADLFYPAVSLNSAGDVITTFDEFIECLR